MTSVAVGPTMPGWGSWEWLGERVLGALANRFSIRTFSDWYDNADADIVYVIKQLPPSGWLAAVAKRCAVIYAPVDYFDSPGAIDRDRADLGHCARILVHCQRLLPYFAGIAPTLYVDHDVNFIAPMRRRYAASGPILWAGVRTNISPVAKWLCDHEIPGPLTILSNFQEEAPLPSPRELGFTRELEVVIERWSRDRQIELTRTCRAAIEVKGQDFRSRHKPPAKCFDFLASGVPIAVNSDSSIAEHLDACGFKVASPDDAGRWLSREYWEECRQFGRGIRRQLSLPKIKSAYTRIFDQVVREQQVERQSNRNRIVVNAVPTLDGHGDKGEMESGDIREVALAGRLAEADARFEKIVAENAYCESTPLWLSNRAAVAAARGNLAEAQNYLAKALTIDPNCESARHNAAIIHGSRVGPREVTLPAGNCDGAPMAMQPGGRDVRVAIVSFLFNWPSTGGGIVHTVELARFLSQAGFEVEHIFARYEPWEIGRVSDVLGFPSTALTFSEREWSLPSILQQYRKAVDRIAPDYVIITDSWNIKPLLAEALGAYRVILRLQAMECLCPLNNVRLLPMQDGSAGQCPTHQFASPETCRECLGNRSHLSGVLHRAERDLCGVGSAEYQESLFRAFRNAEAVLVVNPLTEALVGPYARSVRVVTAGMDPARFPWNEPAPQPPPGRKTRVLFAGLVDEWMKGYRVLSEAAAVLQRKRQDFEIWATADPPGEVNGYVRFVGWHDQNRLPALIRECEILVIPTLAQEALGRTAVEAMAAGRPVVASRIGGLPATVLEEATGLLSDPGDARDLARQMERLIADRELRMRLGRAGRQRFEECYSWPVIIERHYVPLLRPVASGPSSH